VSVPTIAIVDGVAILIYPKDHLPPHVHARIAEYRCKLSIVTGQVIDGKLPPSKLRTVQAWLAGHRGQVAYAWDEISNGRSIAGLIE
jgi:hypothetical protein